MSDAPGRQPQFRRGFDAMRENQERDEIQLRQDITVIRHFTETAGWPSEAAEFARKVLSYFPDVDDDSSEWPDWSATEILEWIVHDLAAALSPPSAPQPD